ncbi:uncharacterized protein [Eleutherodactylus coqui]|uniref:Uncharacterized protein n=1 Tax=Eleutherodactylus coqui TaxID=57060 RepID=A0A8J6EHK8_ELECQ|nr:hypothetical protein GDO78_021169 [Eleutherodactylus coqui]
MNSSPTESGPPSPQEVKSVESNEPPATKEPTQSVEIEKDSGYSDSSSESLSSEDTSSTPPSETTDTPNTAQAQTACASIYILQNIILKEPCIVIQPPLRSHRKRASSSSYLPILRSYPKIAPRLAPSSNTTDTLKEPEPESPPSKLSKQTPPQLLEVSLRALALLRRTQETQRSIRELRAHARLYERAVQGEEGGWERLRKAMERSGGYRKIPPAIDVSRTEEGASDTADSIPSDDDSSVKHEAQTDEMATSPGKSVTSTDSSLSDGDTEGSSITEPAPLVFVHFDFYNNP